ncbi:MAG: ribosome biogenesis GTPase Der [Clostridiales bacterium]|nr:ribosome biogenesis GTPase Der [Clostridiales bacterium]
MSKIPLIAIVGRPNVGKSTLFNKIVGKRISIVEDFEGVTRDRVYADAEWCGKAFTLIDTGGLDIKSEDVMWSHIRAQAELAIDLADAIIFVVDGKSGLTANDHEVAAFLRKTSKPIVIAANKVDNNELDNVYDFYELALGNVIPTSAEHGIGVGDLLDEVLSNFDYSKIDAQEDVLKIAIVGKPNAGKSSLTNRILGNDRVIVSDIAGTTRDAIDTPFDFKGRHCRIIDTAGIRKKASVEEGIEQYSVLRSLAAIREADVVLVVVDASEGLTEQDIKICGYVHEQLKPSVIVMNKWDAIEKDTFTVDKFNAYLNQELNFMDYYVPIYISAKTGQRVEKVLTTALEVYEEASKRVQTGILNDVLADAMVAVEPPSTHGRRLRLYYATQAQTNPPVFLLFVNDASLMHFSYQRYLENTLRKAFIFKGTPIKIIARSREDEEEK